MTVWLFPFTMKLLQVQAFQRCGEEQIPDEGYWKTSPLPHHTYGLEVFHSVMNTFALKSTHMHFFYPAMVAIPW